MEKLDYCIQGLSHSKGSKCQCLSREYPLNCQTFCYQIWYFYASSWAGMSCKKIGSPFSRSRSQQRFIWSKYDSFNNIFWTAHPFASKLSLIVQYHKPECRWRNWITVFKVKVTSKFKMLMNVCPDNIFWIAETFTTTFITLMLRCS